MGISGRNRNPLTIDLLGNAAGGRKIMPKIKWVIATAIVLLVSLCVVRTLPKTEVLNAVNDKDTPKLTATEFSKLMNTVAEGWNEGSARKAADCYTEDAVYTEPPDKQVYVGRQELYEFFGGDKKPERPMKMVWHHLAFDEASQVGFGEYTFQMNNRYHGIVVVKITRGKISNWREYQYKSDMEWKNFIGKNQF
jgi:hypothetical protein